jgi:hypothetical protein
LYGFLNSSVPVPHKIRSEKPDVPPIYKSQKYGISDNAYKIFDFTMAEGSIYISKAAINQPLTASNKRGRGKYVD